MGLNRSSTPTAEFVIEVLKMLDQDELQQVAEYLLERLNEKPVIDIPNSNPIIPISPIKEEPLEVNNLLQNLLNNKALLNKKSLGTLLNLLGGSNLGAILQNQDFENSDDEAPLSIPPPFDRLMSSLLPKLLKVGNEVINPKNQTREDQLIEALLPFFPNQRQNKIRSLQPALRILNLMQSEGILPFKLNNLNKIMKLGKMSKIMKLSKMSKFLKLGKFFKLRK